MSIRLTARLIAAAAPGDVLTDRAHPGLRLVVSDTKKSWQYRYRGVGSKVKQMVLGHYPTMDITAAQLAWGKAAHARHDGNDPAMQRRAAKKAAEEAARPAVTVRTIVTAYMTQHVERKRAAKSARSLRYMLEGHLLPAIGDKLVEEIDAPAATRLLRQVEVNTPSIARVLKAEAAAAWGHAIEGGRIKATNPWRDVMRGQLKVSRRSRYLDDAEIRTLLSWLPGSGIGDHARDALELTLRTACRSGEIVALRWSDVNAEAGSFTLKDTKTDAPRTVRYPEAVAKILERRRQDATLGATFVFSAPADARKHWRQPRLVNAIWQVRSACPVQGWTAHDLRRTARTLMARLGVRNEVAEAALGHTKGGIEAIYNLHRYEGEVGEALTKLNEHIDALVAKPGTVIEVAPFVKTAFPGS